MPDHPPNQHIHIERLVIRTRGLPESTVHAALAGLDTALLAAVAHHPGFPQTPAVIDHLNVAPVQARGDSQQLRQAIAHQIAHTLTSPPPPSPPPSQPS
ncbi:hypothetical protein [Phormidium tenue]|uniref:hypothetical protein n=1 Tax=Phormidium tenue TaxID=126344 RepID=UPI00111517F6|nr:hypothetical protein [Phormidium tenue]MBD2232778.1 hypothetical protein [Phormidium tenue FACHB-1052]